MWMYPANAGAFIHALVDRLMLGDATAEAQVAVIREEMGCDRLGDPHIPRHRSTGK